jgi:hypothetical protein
LKPDYGQNSYSALGMLDISGKSKFTSFVSGGSGTDTIALSNFDDVIHIDGSDNASSFSDLTTTSDQYMTDRDHFVRVHTAQDGDDIFKH